MTCTTTAICPSSNPCSAGTQFAHLRDAHLEYLARKHYSETTAKVRRIRLNMFLSWCREQGITRPDELTRRAVEEYQAHLFRYRKRNGEPLAWSTQHARLISLGVWLKWMARQNLVPYNAVAEIEMPRPEYKLPEFLTSREIEAVLHRARTTTATGLRDRAILETLYSTGMRRSELLHLKLHDLDVHTGVVAVREGKGNRDRVIPIGDRCLAWISRYLAEVRPRFVLDDGEKTLFLTSQGKVFTPNHLSALVRNYVLAAKIGKRGACHLFRHTMATLMLEGGADIRFIQQMLGHARLDTTQIYTHVSIPVLKIVHSQTHPACRPERNKRRRFGSNSAHFRNFAVSTANTAD